jgi:hypothetical protein
VLYRSIVGMLALAVVSAFVIAGCGGGEENSEVTKAQFTKDAETVCAERKKDWEAALAAYEKETNVAKEKETVAEERERTSAFIREDILPLLEEEQAALEDLDVPEADEEKIEQMLQTRSQALEEVEEGGVEAMARNPFLAFEKEAEAYGLDCSLL